MLTFGGHFENCGRQVQEQGLVPSWDSPKFGKTSVDPIACKVQCRGRSERLRSARVGIFLGPVACVAGRFCQSPHGVSALAHLFYFARPTKTAMLRRLGGWQRAGRYIFNQSHERRRRSKAKIAQLKKIFGTQSSQWHDWFYATRFEII